MLHIVKSRIGRRLGATIALGTAVIVLAGLAVFADEAADARDEGTEHLLHTLGSAVDASFHAYDPRIGRHPIDEIAAQLRGEEELGRLDVFDSTGKVRWSLDPRRRGSHVAPAIFRAVFTSSASDSGGDVSGVVIPLEKRSTCLPCHAKDAETLGGVHLVAKHRPKLERALGINAKGLLLTAMIVVVLTALLMLAIDRSILLPLDKLVKVVSKAEEGDFFVRAEVRTNDEIGLLASTFNELLAKITDLRVQHIDREREIAGLKGDQKLEAELKEANSSLRARVKELAFLYELGRDFSGRLELEPLLDRMIQLLHQSLGVPDTAVLLFDETHGQLRVIASRGLRGHDITGPGRTARFEGSIAGDAIATRAPVYVADAMAEERPLFFKGGPETPGTVLAIPIVFQDRLLGLLCLGAPKPDAFTQEDRALFLAVAHQAALAVANAQLFRQTLELSRTDGLTGIPNRRAVEARLDLEWSNALRYKTPMSVLMIDIDWFKSFNDQHGHQLGDETLRRVARILERNVRKVDAIGRYGGEEFVVVLPRAGKDEARKVADKLRRSIEQADFEGGYLQPLGRVTVSVGVATAPDDADSLSTLIGAADQALFRAKAMGRNHVVAAGVLPKEVEGRPS